MKGDGRYTKQKSAERIVSETEGVGGGDLEPCLFNFSVTSLSWCCSLRSISLGLPCENYSSICYSFDAFANGIIFLISFSSCSLLVYRIQLIFYGRYIVQYC